MIKCNLAVLLAERQIRIADIVKNTGISRTTLTSLFYNHGKGIQFETLDTLCKYLNVAPGELLLHSPIDYTFEYDQNDNNFYWYNLRLSIKNKQFSGVVRAYVTIDEYLFDDPQAPITKMSLTVSYPKAIFEEMSKMPWIFSNDITDAIAAKVIENYNTHDELFDITTFSDDDEEE